MHADVALPLADGGEPGLERALRGDVGDAELGELAEVVAEEGELFERVIERAEVLREMSERLQNGAEEVELEVGGGGRGKRLKRRIAQRRLPVSRSGKRHGVLPPGSIPDRDRVRS